MVQYPTANLFTFTDESGSTQLTYYPHAPGPLIAGQPSGGNVRLRVSGDRELDFGQRSVGRGRDDGCTDR